MIRSLAWNKSVFNRVLNLRRVSRRGTSQVSGFRHQVFDKVPGCHARQGKRAPYEDKVKETEIPSVHRVPP